MKFQRILSVAILLIQLNTTFGQSDKALLSNLALKLAEMNSVSYRSERFTSFPWDTVLFKSTDDLVTVFPNSKRPSFAIASSNNPWKYEYCYDGMYKVQLDWENKNATIDTLSRKSQPSYMFFEIIDQLLGYSLEHLDSVEIRTRTYKDSTLISLLFVNQLVEFSPKWETPKRESDQNTEYLVYLNNSSGLPFKLTSKLPHQYRLELVSELKSIENYQDSFNALFQIPPDFVINGSRSSKTGSPTDLIGKKAPMLELKDLSGNQVSLSHFDNEVLILQFTGIDCGPCHQSIPLLNELSSTFESGLEILGIETWEKNLVKIARYEEKNELNYNLLVSTEDTNNSYNIFNGVPIFFVIDKNQIIRGAFVGYSNNLTDKNIKDLLNKLL